MSQPLILGSTTVHLDPFAPPREPEIDPVIFDRLPITSVAPFAAPRLRLVVEGETRAVGPRVAAQTWPAPLRLTRRGKFVVAAVIAVVALVLAVSSLGLALASSPASASTGAASPAARIANGALGGSAETVVVRPGDTLWSIATQLAPNADPRRTVDAIIAANHLAGAAVQAGQRLILP